MAPYVNSYRRITVDGQSAPANLEWASDNRTTGLRIPHGGPEARRVENRVTGMDCNPYLAIAASLAAGYLGMVNRIEPRPAVEVEVWEAEDSLPVNLGDALDLFERQPRSAPCWARSSASSTATSSAPRTRNTNARFHRGNASTCC